MARFAVGTCRLSLAAAVALVALASCGQNYSEKPPAEALADERLTPVAEAPAASRSPAPARPGEAPRVAGQEAVSLDGITGVLPAGWRQVEPSGTMRVAEFELPGEGGAGTLAVFAGTWGAVDDNVTRWVAQFSEPDGAPPRGVERLSLVVGEGEAGGGLQVVRVAVSGTYRGGMGMGGQSAQPGYRLVGAIVASGSGYHYLKAVGPEPTITAQEKAFDAFVASLRRG